MIHHTVCRLCSACCPIKVEVDNGKLIKAERKSFLPENEKLVCPKLRFAPEIVYSKSRILKPLLRESLNEDFWEVSWEEALSVVSEKLQKTKDLYGAQAVAWLRGMAADWGTPWDWANRFMNAFGSPNTLGNGSVCHVAREIAHYYTYGTFTLPLAKNSKCIVVWGKNDKNTAPAMAEAILYAKREGAKLIVIDPVRTFFAKRADLWLPIKPGHDGLLAMAMIHEILSKGLYDKDFVDKYSIGVEKLWEVAEKYPSEKVANKIWIDAEVIKKTASVYATTKPACIIDGNGLDMHLEVFDTVRAISILRVLTGNIDIPGGDFIPQPVPLRNIQLRELVPDHIKPVTAKYELFNKYHPTWGLHAQSCLIDAIIDEDPYGIKALIVQSGNPAVTMTESNRVRKALEKLDFLVVIDLFHTQTTKYAHVVLPATTCFEKTQINRAFIRNNPIILQDQVIPWVGESRADWKIIFDLARMVGCEKYFPWETVEEALDYQLEPANITVEDLRKNPEGIYIEPVRYEKYKDKGFSTPSGKAEIYSQRLKSAGFNGIPYEEGFPDNPISYSDLEGNFIAISGERTNCYTHTQFHQIDPLRSIDPEPFVEIHPKDAEKENIKDGNEVIITTPKGEVTMKVRISTVVPEKVIRIPWGWGEVNMKWNVNNLTDDSVRNPLTATPSARTFYCKLKKLA